MGGMPDRYDLNADVGEGFAFDAELMGVISSANVACGFHAGDWATMRRLCGWAAERGVAVGAQVSYRDRDGFGRRDVEIAAGDLVADLAEQIDTLRAAAGEASTSVRYLKPHGALYNRCVHDADQAGAVLAVAATYGLPLLGLPGSLLLELASAGGLQVRREFFADRAYERTGRLVARTVPGAVIQDTALVAARICRLVRSGTVGSIDDVDFEVTADSICVHGDTADAASLARSVRSTLAAEGVTVAACW
jgi:5-oxoprolinase (ATP-hydrolysing) subunit A